MEEEAVTKAVGSVIKQIKAPNIAVLGATGTGKSSLINAVFGKDLAEVGAGLPVTRGFHLYSNELVNIYDSAGYELGEGITFVDNIIEFFQAKEIAGIEQQIHLVWYLINAASARVERFNIEIISQLRKRGIPLIVVLSQADRARPEEIDSIKQLLAEFKVTQAFDVIEVAASPLLIRGKPICEPFGLEELVAKTLERLPEIYADAVRMAQIVDLKSKRELAWKLIVAAAAATFSSGFIPIPGVTTGASLAIQGSLVISIASVYGFRHTGELLLRNYAGIVTTSVLGFAGATLGLDIVKSFIPGVGNVLTGGTAATLIVITGLAYASAFEAMAKAHINLVDSEETKKFFINSFKQGLQEYSNVVIRNTTDLGKVKDRFLKG